MVALYVLFAVAILVSNLCTGYGSESHLICKQVEEVFERQEGVSHPATRDHRALGPPGKQGVPGTRGIQGSRGPAGPTGTVDYGRVNAMVNDSMTPALINVMTRLDEMNSKFEKMIQNLNNSIVPVIQKREPKRLELCKVVYGDKCFWMIVHDSSDITYSEAQQLCSNKKGTPANVYSEQNYDDIVAYVRQLKPDATVFFWLGMRIDPSTRTVTNSDGRRAEFLHWRSNYPRSSSSYTHVAIQLTRDPSSSSQGMFNYGPSGSLPGVVCEL